MHNCTSGAGDEVARAPLNVSWHETAASVGSRKGWRSRLRHDRLPWRPTQEPSMKRNSQSRSEHQKVPAKAAKNPATSEKTQLNQNHCGSPECDQPATPGTAMEFSFKGCSVRTVHQGKDTWFVVADVCAVLELTNPTKAILRLDEDEKGLTTIQGSSGRQELNVVNESGLYHLLFTS